MVLTAHQPVYLPWLGLIHKIVLSDKFVFFNQVQYLPKDWNNRNRIKTPQGPFWLSVPVLRKGYREKNIGEIEINNDLPWQRKHWRSILASYSQAPYFEMYASFLQDVYQREWIYLADLNEHMLRWLLEVFDIRAEFLKASDFNFQGTKSELVLDMCKQLAADVYIFGTLGKDYAKVEEFESAGIRAHFQSYRHPEYPQLHGEFISHLSVLDLLFNCGPTSLEILMNGQEAIAV